MTAKLTPAMVTALTGATFSESRKGLAYSDADATHTGWTLKSGTNGRTLSAMRKRGLCMGDGGLTDAGVSAMAAQNGMGALTTPAPVVESIPSPTNAHTDAQSLECTCAPNGDNSWCAAHYPAPVIADGMDTRFPMVEIQGADGFDMVPDMSALTGECFYGCGRPVTGMFCDYVGKTEGVCDFDRDKLGDHTTIAPVDPAIWGGKGDNVDTVNVVQAHMGMNGMNHYHAPGCRDIVREMQRHNARKGLGMYEFPFASVAEIIEFEYADVENGDAHDMINHANDDYDGIKVMGCLSIPMGAIQGYPLMFTGGRWMLGDMPLDSERCTVCEVYGNVSENSTDVDGKHVCGYCVDNGRTVATLETHSLTFYVETERAGIKYECTSCRSIDTRANFAEFVCEGAESPIHNAFDNDDSDAGFVETLVTKEYELSVIVDETTGTRISLGWVTLTMNAAQCMDWDRVAEEYGRTQNTRTPRHGWASIITVHDVADI